MSEHARFLLSLGLLIVLPLASLGASGFEGNPEKIAVELAGTVTEAGDLLLAVAAGEAVTRSLEVYSEPSHAPLLFLAPTSFSDSEEGEAWQAGWTEGPAAFVELADATAPAEVVVERPDGDTRLEVRIWGLWTDGAEEERLVADVEVGGGDFSFFSVPDEPPGSYTHCCVGEDGSDSCAVCSSASFSCTPLPVCTEP